MRSATVSAMLFSGLLFTHAQAATISQTVFDHEKAEGVYIGDFANDIHFDAFDKSLGTLTKASMYLSSMFQYHATWDGSNVTDYDQGFHLNYQGESGFHYGDIAVLWKSIEGSFFYRYEIPHGEVGHYDSPVFHAVDTVDNRHSTTDDLDLAALSDPQWSYIIFDDFFDAGHNECMTRVEHGCGTESLEFDAFHELTVVYDYIPAPVPETATWALMILGFGGIGLTLRQRRSGVSVQAPADVC